MPNDLPDWAQNAAVPGQSLTLPTGVASAVTTVTLPNRAGAMLLDVLTGNLTLLRVLGLTSNETYLNQQTPPPGSRSVIITDSRDAQVNVRLDHTTGLGADLVDVSFMPAAVIAMLAAGSVADVTDRAGRLLGVVNSIATPPQLSATPQPWQAPGAYAAAELGAVGSIVMVTGVLGQTVRLFGWSIEVDQAAAASIGWLEDTTSPAGTVTARLAAFSSPGNSGGSGYEAGKPVTLGQGIRLNVPLIGAGGLVRATIGYSQA